MKTCTARAGERLRDQSAAARLRGSELSSKFIQMARQREKQQESRSAIKISADRQRLTIAPAGNTDPAQ